MVDIWLRNRVHDKKRPILLSFETATETVEVTLSGTDARLLGKALLSRASCVDIQPWNNQVEQ